MTSKCLKVDRRLEFNYHTLRNIYIEWSMCEADVNENANQKIITNSPMLNHKCLCTFTEYGYLILAT